MSPTRSHTVLLKMVIYIFRIFKSKSRSTKRQETRKWELESIKKVESLDHVEIN